MHLKIQKRKGRAYLSIVQNYRHEGKVKSRTVETIGYADTFADQYEDPLAHFREYARELSKASAALKQPISLSFDADEAIAAPATPPARLGASVALGCLDALGVGSFFRSRAGGDDFPAHAGRIFEMLATERMMHATSKRESWTARKSFPRACDFSFSEVYEALSCFAREKTRLDARMLRAWQDIGGNPDTNRIFLVCGSYSFPIDGGAERASIAVALDRHGMPLGYHDMSGRLGPETFRAAASQLKERLGAQRAVVIAGGLRDVGPTIAELTSTGDGFALYQRDFKQTPELAAWAQDEDGYTSMGGDVHLKWRTTTRQLDDGTPLPVKEVVLRGGGYATRYSHALLVSSELDLSATTIVQLYRELWRQAEPFQPLEADFSSMPYATPARDHIQAHFALCYAAFAALRILRWKMGWKHNAADSADALLRMEGVYLQQNYYLFNYRSEVTDAIEQATGIEPARRLRTRGDLRSIPQTVKQSFTHAERQPRADGGTFA